MHFNAQQVRHEIHNKILWWGLQSTAAIDEFWLIDPSCGSVVDLQQLLKEINGKQILKKIHQLKC